MTQKAINKLHLGVYAAIVKNDALLVIKKARGPYTGLLDLPGGRMEHGEAIHEALAREVLEETGVIAIKSELMEALTHQVEYDYEGERINMHQVGIIHHVTDFDDSNLIEDMHDQDSNGAVWISLKDCDLETLSPFAQQVVTNLKTLD